MVFGSVLLPVLFVYMLVQLCVCVCVSVQRALKILHPIILDEFLDAVEGYGAFCSGAQLQDLMLLSDSVRKQWEVKH